MDTLYIMILFLMGLHRSICVEMRADIDVGGYKGNVDFVRAGNDANVTLTFTAGANSNQYDTVDLYTLPAVFGYSKTAVQVCDGGVGEKISDLITGGKAATVTMSESSYLHRSVVISSSTNPSMTKLCATILPTTASVTTYRAKLMGPVFGTVWIRHVSEASGSFVYGDLVTSGNTVSRDLVMYGTGSVDDSVAYGSRCESLSGAKEPVAAGITVQGSTQSDGAFGSFINGLVTFQNNLAVVNGDTIVACATLRMVSSKTVTSIINWEGVKGSFEFTQKSPFDATSTVVVLTGLSSRTSGYHVHKFPVGQRLSSTENPCAGQFVSGHFNPYGVDVNSSPAAGNGSSDEYEIGDLSGKYGTFAGEDSVAGAVYTDWNLPLFGINSIVGRSMVIHNADAGATRLLCASIGYPSVVKTGIAVFKAPAYGTMYFRQDQSNPDEDTSIFLELASQDKALTKNHNWHVHVYPVNDDAFASSGACASAGGHYNPSGVSVEDPYATECQSNDALRCELGDLSGRLGGINVVSTQRTEQGKYFYTDEFLPLSGALSVLGRSVVVHGANEAAGRYACANITQLHPTVARTTSSWVGAADGSASGTVTMEQETEFDTTKVTGSFSNLANLASGYHIHEYMIPTDAAAGNECSDSSVSGHYNPFNWTATTAATTGTYDRYEVGDLSNKYGLLDSQTTYSIPTPTDTNLPLHTYLSASDRSIVIHKKENDARWKCANLVTVPASGSNGHVISATVNFTQTVTGTIKLRQIVYDDGGAGMTTYEVDVSPKSGNANTPQHNWHIHVDPITDEDSCSDALGHYDPYDAINNADYKTDCKPENPLFCEVGDTSNKQAKYDIGGGRRVFHDADTPLHTNFTVLGRSIVFHVRNGGADRYTCANIVPDDYIYTLSFPQISEFNRYNFTKTIADALGIARLRVVIVHNLDVPVKKGGCSYIMMHIAGGGSVQANKLSQLMDGTLAGLGQYSPSSKCTSTTGAMVLGQHSDKQPPAPMMIQNWIFSLIYYLRLWAVGQEEMEEQFPAVQREFGGVFH